MNFLSKSSQSDCKCQCDPHEQRTEKRLLCSNLARVSWRAETGQVRTEVCVIEDVSGNGLALCLDAGIIFVCGTVVSIRANCLEATGYVIYCNSRDTGWLVGLELHKPCEWLNGRGPEHLVDVMSLDLSVARTRR